MTTATLPDDLSFEQGYEELQAILQQLDAGELPLDQTLDLYEKGIQLANFCGQKLESAQLRVRRWQESGEHGEFDGWQ